jgi:valyl-tRNA synthetase
MNGIVARSGWDPATAASPLARWILEGANAAIAEATAALEAFRFDDYANALYRFTWNSFCDWFLEFAKPVLNGPDGAEKEEVRGAAQHVLGVILRLLHPVMPFITEELWTRLGYGGEASLLIARWPEAAAVHGAAEARTELDDIVRLISEVRAVRAEVNVPPSITTKLLVQGASDGTLARAGRWIDAIRRLARVTEIEVLDGAPPKGVAQAVVGEATLLLPLADVIDLGAERARLAKDRAKVEGEVKKVRAKLDNADFMAKAKEEVIEENRERLADAEAEIARLDAALARIAG